VGNTRECSLKLSIGRVSYKQNWPAYNAAQTEEKERFVVLLDALCKLIDQPVQAKGRPRLPLADMVFACAYKVYSCFSSRRFMSDLREAQMQEHVYKAGHFNSVSRYLGPRSWRRPLGREDGPRPAVP
jgi:hypothetical protein